MQSRLLPAAIVASLLLASPAMAQSLDSLKKGAGDFMKSQSSQGSSAGGGAGLLSSLGSGSFNPGSMQNVAGVLGYCQQKGYTQGTTEQVKSSLMDKLGGQQKAAQSDSYQKGLGGLLQGGNGQSFSLTGLKDQAGEKACSMVADKAMSSFL